jgi:hypothetical protein
VLVGLGDVGTDELLDHAETAVLAGFMQGAAPDDPPNTLPLF